MAKNKTLRPNCLGWKYSHLLIIWSWASYWAVSNKSTVRFPHLYTVRVLIWINHDTVSSTCKYSQCVQYLHIAPATWIWWWAGDTVFNSQMGPCPPWSGSLGLPELMVSLCALPSRRNHLVLSSKHLGEKKILQKPMLLYLRKMPREMQTIWVLSNIAKYFISVL